jgi:uncharacterized protein
MPAVFPLFEASEAFRPVRAAGRPIFRQDCAEYALFYAPGCLCVVAQLEADRFETAIASLDTPLVRESEEGQNSPVDWRAELWRRADQAIEKANSWREEPFSPECLTLYMNNECNLSCVYCHTDPSPRPVARLELEAIAAAGEVVAESCRQKGVPFYIVFHGGGEPTLHRGRVDSAMARLEAVACAHGVEPFRYVATNGVMSEEKARWLAHHFDLVGLSCDGPAEIQNRQRPSWSGRDTSRVLERTAYILREEGCRLHVRTTITGATLNRQAEIADYICQQFSPEEIHFEPVYVGGRTSTFTRLDAHQANEFVTNFLEAQELARRCEIPLLSSGSRPGSIHGPYCHVFRRVINLVPGGLATACFKITEAAQIEERGADIGSLNRDTGRFEIDHFRVQALRQQLNVTLPECAECFNRYHCARECPDCCPLDKDAHPGSVSVVPGFRCRAQKALAYASLRKTAERLWSARLEEEIVGNGKTICGESSRIVYGTAIL